MINQILSNRKLSVKITKEKKEKKNILFYSWYIVRFLFWDLYRSLSLFFFSNA